MSSVTDMDRGAGLLIDTNLLVLFAVGSVNLARIQENQRI
jgi:hypothetical protein